MLRKCPNSTTRTLRLGGNDYDEKENRTTVLSQNDLLFVDLQGSRVYIFMLFSCTV